MWSGEHRIAFGGNVESKEILDSVVHSRENFENDGESAKKSQYGAAFHQLLDELLGSQARAQINDELSVMDLAPKPQEMKPDTNTSSELAYVEKKHLERADRRGLVEGEKREEEEIEYSVVQDEESSEEITEEVQEEELVETEVEEEIANEEVIEAEEELMDAIQEQDEEALIAAAEETEAVTEMESVEAPVEVVEAAETVETVEERTAPVELSAKEAPAAVEEEAAMAVTSEAGEQESAAKAVVEKRVQGAMAKEQDSTLPKEFEGQGIVEEAVQVVEQPSVETTQKPAVEAKPEKLVERVMADVVDESVQEASPVVASDPLVIAPKEAPVKNAGVKIPLEQAIAPGMAGAGADLSGGQNGGMSSGNQSFGMNNLNIHLKEAAEKVSNSSGKKSEKSLPRELQDKTVERVKELLNNAAKSRNNNTLVVRMDPPNLGALTMKVTHKAGKVHARIIPESAEVETALRGRVPELIQVLAANGLNRENVHVSIGAEHSETELYQFNEFFNRHQGEEKKGQRFSGREEGGEGSVTGLNIREGNLPQESGWIA